MPLTWKHALLAEALTADVASPSCYPAQEALDGHLHSECVRKGGRETSGRWLPSTQ